MLILYSCTTLLYCIILQSKIYMIQPPILHLLCFHLIVCMTVNFSRYHARFQDITFVFLESTRFGVYRVKCACACTAALEIIIGRVRD